MRRQGKGSIQPVFKAQAGDLREVGRVATQERDVVSESYAGDLQVHRANAQALMAELEE